MNRWTVLLCSFSLALGILIGSFLTATAIPIPTTPELIVHPQIVEASFAQVGHTERVHISHYSPWLGGVNCSAYVSGQCVARMANGERWQDNIGRAAACPREWRFGTLIVLPGGEVFECKDRGGKIVYDADGYAWIDLLVSTAPVNYGTLIDVRVIEP